MRHITALFCGFLASASMVAAQSVQFSAPANGDTVSSPVNFVASGSNGVTALRIYVDDQAMYTVDSSQLNTSIALASGQHRVVLVGWDGAGNAFTSTENIAVGFSRTGIAVSTPANGATSSSQVHFAAAAGAPAGRSIVALWIYVDDQPAFQSGASSVDTSLNLAPGGHYVVFQAWDNSGAVFKQAVSINVQSAVNSNPVPAPIPTSGSTPFQSNLTATGQWVRANSVAGDGAILYGSSQINPYYSNLAAIGLTHDPASYATVQRWMQWYVNHLNWPDKWGLYGTTYDYDYNNGAESSHNTADSTDSYAATFLTLAWSYYQTGDPSAQNYIRTLAYQLDVIGGVLVQTQQSDGLTWAKPDYKIKYLMDNCEAYRGLRDLALVFQYAFGDQGKAAYYNAAADQMLQGIQGMWMGSNWAVYKDGIGRLIGPNMGTWYPDATSQVFPVLEGVVPAADSRSQQAYNNLNNAWPGWQSMSYNQQDPFPWILVGDAAIVMGDSDRVNTFVQQIENKYVNKGFPWTFYSAEAGWFMRLNAYALGARPL